MIIWHQEMNLEEVNGRGKNTMAEHLDINFTEIGDDYLEATMPSSHKTVQPRRIINGGAYAALAETVGSTAANYTVDFSKLFCIGIEINANHIRAAKEGSTVIACATPIHRGAKTQIWEIRIRDEADRLMCICRHTVMVLAHQKDS